MLLLSLATPFLLTGILHGLAQVRHSRDSATAAAWMQGELEIMRARCYADLRPTVRKVTAATAGPGELAPPAGFAVALVTLEPAGPVLLRASIAVYRHDWAGDEPPEAPAMASSTFISDVRSAGQCR